MGSLCHSKKKETQQNTIQTNNQYSAQPANINSYSTQPSGQHIYRKPTARNFNY